MAVIRGNRIGMILCEALGLDPETVRGLTFTVSVGSVAMVTVDMYVSRDNLDPDRFSELKKFKLVPIDE